MRREDAATRPARAPAARPFFVVLWARRGIGILSTLCAPEPAALCVALMLVSLGGPAPARGQTAPAGGRLLASQQQQPQEPGAQQPAPQETPPAAEQFGGSIMQFVEQLPASEAAAFTFHNREITTLRARVLGRTPEERSAAGVQRLNELISRGGDHTLDLAPFETAILVRMDGESVIAIAPQDLDPLSGETVSGKAAEALEAARRGAARALEPAAGGAGRNGRRRRGCIRIGNQALQGRSPGRGP